ncbi:hypothetical protein N7481_013239 [Penicillium waksmanii]|uniref:uncharacterized protein n=1 Tax=Penicillium waksmanii TaxID=69791 RepID=UPI00254942FA|nr:uncharacterized protein N7481_013239 [Penicillium waksmanii]KAJ5966525.1 hypothetical protein N7481_013239 [Penicillium waksmanii]
MEYVTTDYVCDAMLHIASNNNQNLDNSFSLLAPHSSDSVKLEKTVEVINNAGHPVQRIPYWDWVKRLHDPKNKDTPLIPLMPLLQEKVWGKLTRFETSRDTPHYDAPKAVAALADAPNIRYVPFTPVKKYNHAKRYLGDGSSGGGGGGGGAADRASQK